MSKKASKGDIKAEFVFMQNGKLALYAAPELEVKISECKTYKLKLKVLSR